MIVKSTEARSQQAAAVFTLAQLAVPEYSEMLKLWEICDDCFAGELAVKAKDDQYIYRPSSKQGDTDLSRKAWEAFKGRGKFPNLPAESLEKMVGVLCAKPPDVSFSGKAEKLEFLRNYATPFRDGLEALFSRTVENVLRSGRTCLLLEPDNGEGTGFHINEYRARKFLRAKVNYADGESFAKLILLDTSSIDYDYTVWKDVYSPQITLLALTEPTGSSPAVYYQAKFGRSGVKIAGYKNGAAVWDDAEQYHLALGEIFGMLEAFRIDDPDSSACTIFNVPDKFGRTLDRIPFTCINLASLNFMRFERPPLLNLCLRCLHILNADCDHQQALYMTTDPVAVIYGADAEKKVELGADRVLFLPEGSKFEYVSANSQGLDQQARNIEQMIAEAREMGISLSGTDGLTNTPVGTMQLYRDSQVAGLQTINQTCGKGIEEQLRFAGRWIGMTPEETARDIRFTPSSDFAEIKATAQECVTLANSRAALQLTREEVRKYTEKNGLADPRPWPEVREELDQLEAEKQQARLDSVAGAFGFGEENEEEPEE